MSKKKLLCLTLCIGLVLSSLTGCSSDKAESNDADAKKKVESALDSLENLDKTYEVSNVMQAPDGNLCYVEICSNGASYTEYPVDADGNYGTIAFQDSADVEYVLTDWVTSDGKGYMLTGNDTWVSYPDSYSKKLKSRSLMYFDVIVDKMTGLSFKETVTADIGMGDESIDVYIAKLDSETVGTILGLGSEEIYKSIESSTKDENIKKLCGYYLDDISFTMVFSDANVTIGVVDGVLRYVQLEVGGLGSRLYYTKAILTQDVDVRQEPDFSNVDTYESTMKDMADYVANYDSYEEAMQALSGSTSTSDDLSGTTDGDAVESTEEQLDSTESVSEESTDTTESVESTESAE